jgi:hypothetical protein
MSAQMARTIGKSQANLGIDANFGMVSGLTNPAYT